MVSNTKLIARKTGDQSVSSNIVVQADTQLLLPMAASGIYAVRLVCMFALAGVTSGYNFTIDGPAATNVMFAMEVRNMSVYALVKSLMSAALGDVLSGALAVAATHIFTVEGTIENGGGAGNLGLKFAQAVSDVGAITVKRGSYLTLTPMN
jgi:hypothetical protein